MEIPVSSATAAREWLYGRLREALTPDTLSKRSQLLVCDGPPGPNQPDDIVSVGGVAVSIETNSLVGSGGAGWLQETYTITVDIEVYRGGDSSAAAFARAQVLSAGVIQVAREDPSMGGTVLIARPTASACETEWAENSEGVLASASVTISCMQRI